MAENIFNQLERLSVRRSHRRGKFQIAATGGFVGIEFDARKRQFGFALEQALKENVVSDALRLEICLLEEFPIANILWIGQIDENSYSLCWFRVKYRAKQPYEIKFWDIHRGYDNVDFGLCKSGW